MLRVGDQAPQIDAPTSLGTRETKYFRDNHVELLLAGATVVGVSTDDLATQCSFAESLRAPFPMIADADQSISRSYDVLWPIVGLARRVTYVVSPQRVVEAVFHHELKVEEHRNDVLRFVNQKFRTARAG